MAPAGVISWSLSLALPAAISVSRPPPFTLPLSLVPPVNPRVPLKEVVMLAAHQRDVLQLQVVHLHHFPCRVGGGVTGDVGGCGSWDRCSGCGGAAGGGKGVQVRGIIGMVCLVGSISGGAGSEDSR